MIVWLWACTGPKVDSGAETAAPVDCTGFDEAVVQQGAALPSSVPDVATALTASWTTADPSGSRTADHTWTGPADRPVWGFPLGEAVDLSWAALDGDDTLCEATLTLTPQAPQVLSDLATETDAAEGAYLVRTLRGVNTEDASIVGVWDPYGRLVYELTGQDEVVDTQLWAGELWLLAAHGALSGSTLSRRQPGVGVVDSWDVPGAHHKFGLQVDGGEVVGIHGLGYAELPDYEASCGAKTGSSTVFYAPLDGDPVVLYDTADDFVVGHPPSECPNLLAEEEANEMALLHYANSWEGPDDGDWGCATLAGDADELVAGICLEVPGGDSAEQVVTLGNPGQDDADRIADVDIFDEPHSMQVLEGVEPRTYVIYNRAHTTVPICSHITVVQDSGDGVVQLGRYPADASDEACLASGTHGNVRAVPQGEGWRFYVHHATIGVTDVVDSDDFVSFTPVERYTLAPIPDGDGELRPVFLDTAPTLGGGEVTHTVSW